VAKTITKEIELEYSFDRLSAKKIGQAYQLLVPNKIWPTSYGQQRVKQQAGEARGERERVCV